MIIHILVHDGSPVGVTLSDLWGDGSRGIGVGGSEYALLTMCEAWHTAGHQVVLFNSPMGIGSSPFEQRPIHTYDPNEPRDVLIVFRSPNPRSVQTTNCLKVWWSCDQYTIGSFAEFSHSVDKIVCISPFHANFFRDCYGIHHATVIDLPVRIADLDAVGPVEKVGKATIFTSVPDRGLQVLRTIWPTIHSRCPGVSVTITSDYRLWGVEERNWQHRVAWQGVAGVRFLGALPRRDLIREQLKAQLLIYPCIYDELFCVAVAEAQCSGVYPVTSPQGALATTNLGKVIPGDVRISGEARLQFIDTVANLLNGDPKILEDLQQQVRESARKRFSLETILKQWDERIFNDKDPLD